MSATNQRQIDTLLESVRSNSQLQEQFKADPVGTLETISATTQQPAYLGDIWIYRTVVAVLGIVVIFATVSYFALAMYKIDPPQALIALGATALGAIAGLLAPSPLNK